MVSLTDSTTKKKQADQALCEFLQEIKDADVASLQLDEIISILVRQCSQDQVSFNRLTAIQWIQELVTLGRERLKDLYADMLNAILLLLADEESEIRAVARTANENLLNLVRKTEDKLDFSFLLQKLEDELNNKDETTRIASLSWISMLLSKDASQVLGHMNKLFPLLVDKLLCDQSDNVVMMNLEVLARIACNEDQFIHVLRNVVRLFREDRSILESRGTMIVRNLCLKLDAEKIFMNLSKILLGEKDLTFASVMIQTLNHILLTSSELLELRSLLQRSLSTKNRNAFEVFKTLYSSWCHNPVATFSLCLLAQAYPLSSSLVGKFADVDVTLGFLVQIDRLVQLLESPIFVGLRLQLLEPESETHAHLVKSLFGILMLLPQSSAFKTLRDRLMSVSALYLTSSSSKKSNRLPSYVPILLDQFTEIRDKHTKAREDALKAQRLDGDANNNSVGGMTVGVSTKEGV